MGSAWQLASGLRRDGSDRSATGHHHLQRRDSACGKGGDWYLALDRVAAVAVDTELNNTTTCSLRACLGESGAWQPAVGCDRDGYYHSAAEHHHLQHRDSACEKSGAWQLALGIFTATHGVSVHRDITL